MSHPFATRLVQLIHPDEGRRAALVDGNDLHLLATYRSIHEFALTAATTKWRLRDLLSTDLSGIVLDYQRVYRFETAWRFLPAFDHPQEPGRCLVSGISSGNWKYLGSGDSLHGHGESLAIADPPAEIRLPEVAAAYVIGEGGTPRRAGLAAGIRGPRRSVLGPELVLDSELLLLDASAELLRAGRKIWSRTFASKSVSLPLALAAVEADHFTNADHRRRGDTHVHFFGEKLFNAMDSPSAQDGDEAIVELIGFGCRLNTRVEAEQPATVLAGALPL
jgi:hypothetical protein